MTKINKIQSYLDRFFLTNHRKRINLVPWQPEQFDARTYNSITLACRCNLIFKNNTQSSSVRSTNSPHRFPCTCEIQLANYARKLNFMLAINFSSDTTIVLYSCSHFALIIEYQNYARLINNTCVLRLL